MTQNAKPLNASDIDTLRLFYAQPMFPAHRQHISRDIRDLIATIDQQAKQLECGDCGNPKGFAILCADCWSHYYRSVADVTSAAISDETPIATFGSEVLRHILADTSFFESEESEQWCELLERHGYVERGVWDSAKHGEHNVLGHGDAAWIFTEKMRRDAARSEKENAEKCPMRPATGSVETITGAAILDAHGVPRSLPLPASHHRVMRMRFTTEELPMRSTQGFVTSAGRFVDRREARRIAVAAGQVVSEKTYQPDELFSEDFIRAAPGAPDCEAAKESK